VQRAGLALLALAKLAAAAVPLAAQDTSASRSAGVRSVVVAGSGDVLGHIRVVRAARVGGWDRVLAGLGELVRESDVAFANLETPLSEERPVESGSPPILGAPPEPAAALGRPGIDVLRIAKHRR